jgi:hypothetical protein
MTRGISTRTTPDGIWTYTPKVLVQCVGSNAVNCQQQLTVKKPNGENSVYTVLLYGGAWSIEGQFYNGAVSPSNLLATITQSFDFSHPCAERSNLACYVNKTSETTTLPLPGGMSVNRTTQYSWDRFSGNLLTNSEWNFYAGSLPATADRQTTYKYLNTSAYLSKNIVNRPTSATVTDKNGGIVSQTVNCYDYSGGCGGSSFSSVTGIAQHDDTNFGASNTVRGDLT